MPFMIGIIYHYVTTATSVWWENQVTVPYPCSGLYVYLIITHHHV